LNFLCQALSNKSLKNWKYHNKLRLLRGNFREEVYQSLQESNAKQPYMTHQACGSFRLAQVRISVLLPNICSNEYPHGTRAQEAAWFLEFILGSGSANEALSFSTIW
jgi:hypothetical protein